MRSTFIACALTAALSAGAQAQLGTPGRTETAQRLNQAVTARQNEEASANAQAATRAALANTADQARSELNQPVDPAEAARDAAARKRMAEALQGISPEGKAMLAQNDAPLLKVPSGPAAIPATPEAPATGAPKPKPLKPEPLTEAAPPDTKQTVIVGDLTYFDSANSIAVFVGNVVVDSPQFHITCDEFEVHMRKQEKEADAKDKDGKPVPGGKPADTKAGKSAAQPKQDVKSLAVNAPVTSPGATGGKAGAAVVHDAQNPLDNSIEKAIAKGRKVVIVKHNPDGKIQIGQSRFAFYDGDTGDITLRQSPQVQDGNDLHISLEPTTVMVMTQAGALHTTGRATTKLTQQEQEGQPGAQGKGPATPGTAPAPGASKTSKGLSIPGPVPGQ